MESKVKELINQDLNNQHHVMGLSFSEYFSQMQGNFQVDLRLAIDRAQKDTIKKFKNNINSLSYNQLLYHAFLQDVEKIKSRMSEETLQYLARKSKEIESILNAPNLIQCVKNSMNTAKSAVKLSVFMRSWNNAEEITQNLITQGLDSKHEITDFSYSDLQVNITEYINIFYK